MSIHYKESDRSTLMACCNEIQFEHSCAYCYERMGCYYCSFDLDTRHDCMQD
jgi:hypothetical protein